MEGFFCIIGIVIVIIGIFLEIISENVRKRKTREDLTSYHPYNPQQSRPQVSSTPPTVRPSTLPPNKNAYRPTSMPGTRPTIRFINVNDNPIPQNMPKLEDLHDAFTGAPLNTNLGLYQCSNCKVFYHADSYTILKEVNNSKCVSCQSTLISAINITAPSKFGREYTPSYVTLQNYRNFVGQVVTFEGYAYQVVESRRGNDFAVLFEDEGWVRSFKLVFFRDSVSAMGGRHFIHTLGRKKIRVRGLIVNDPTFGYEIIVSERGMILEISS